MIRLNTPWKDILKEGVELVRKAKRSQECMDEWFLVQEIKMQEARTMREEGRNPDDSAGQADLLCRMVRHIPISIIKGSAIAGTQDGAFSASYALINPSFKVEEFAGYCDPTAIYDDVLPNSTKGITKERIQIVRQYWEMAGYVKELQEIYAKAGEEINEVVYFMEPVTGHTIPDLRSFLKNGIVAMQQKARESGEEYGRIMATALEAAIILAERYRVLAKSLAQQEECEKEKARLLRIADILSRVPVQGAKTLHEAIQSFVLLWQVMALEQAPNPYAFSAGNLDRVLQPYYSEAETSREEVVELVRHLLCFFQVGKRCWAISQNVIVGGRDEKGRDLACDMTYVLLDAFFETNDPQPALSVKVHSGTGESLYHSLGRFFFSPGHSTPSLFNDDVMFEILRNRGVAEEDLPDYCIAGCQEPLIMGKASLNTTNTWLNLAKVLELALNDGISLITGKKIGPSWEELSYTEGVDAVYANLEQVFFGLLEKILPHMQEAGNSCTVLLGKGKPVPLTSALMDSFHTWRDMRDPREQGTRYNASGCLIHGLSVVADSLYAVDRAISYGEWTAVDIRAALQKDFEGYEELHHFLSNQDKFGNDCDEVDEIAVRLVNGVSDMVSGLKNPTGNNYLADWSTPSTHLLYGYWVGATPDGRKSRTMLGYGVDPHPAFDRGGLPNRLLSAWKLPYLKMTGGYASHIGLRQTSAKGVDSFEEKGIWMRDNVIKPLFRLGVERGESPYYVYFNVDSANHLRQVLKNPKKYAPNGIYIMRIHGTFVNFLDLSPAIQEDIIMRLEPEATA
ncbi:MAG: pyruvate formate lyase family protein [Planctomycetota bacterium]